MSLQFTESLFTFNIFLSVLEVGHFLLMNPSSLTLLPSAICCKAHSVNFLFQLLIFSVQEFPFALLLFLFLCYDSPTVNSFSFKSLNIFIIAALKSSFANINIWIVSGFISIGCFAFEYESHFEYGFSFFFLFAYIIFIAY